MRFKSFTTRLSFSISIASVIIYGIIISYSTTNSYNKDIQTVEEELFLAANNFALEISEKLESPLFLSQTLSNIFASQLENNLSSLSRDNVNSMLKKMLTENSFFLGIGTVWEANAFDNKDDVFIGTEGHDKSGVLFHTGAETGRTN